METPDPILPLLLERAGQGSPLVASYFEFYGAGESEELESLLNTIDGSDYSLEDWIEALVAFDDWLAAREELRRPLPEIFSYIHCCTLPQRPGVALAKLNIVVNEALTEFGFAFLSEAQI